MLLFFSFLECVYTFPSLPKQNPYLWGENVILQLLSMCLTLREDATVHSEIEFTAYRCTFSLQSIPFVLTDDTSVSFLSRLGRPLTSQEKKIKNLFDFSAHLALTQQFAVQTNRGPKKNVGTVSLRFRKGDFCTSPVE